MKDWDIPFVIGFVAQLLKDLQAQELLADWTPADLTRYVEAYGQSRCAPSDFVRAVTETAVAMRDLRLFGPYAPNGQVLLDMYRAVAVKN